MKITLDIHSTSLDYTYGKYDVAPRIFNMFDDKVGYLLAYRISDGDALVIYDDDVPRFVAADSFQVI